MRAQEQKLNGTPVQAMLPVEPTRPTQPLQPNGGNPFSTRMTITPEYAGSLLASNKGNRSLSDMHVFSLATDMEQGRWVFNFDTILVSADGTLYDGQHRLRACVLAGKPFECMVVFNATAAMRDSKDIGRVRKAGDIAEINGVINSRRVAGLAKLVVIHRSLGISQIKSKKQPSKTAIQEEITSNGEKLQAALVFGRLLCQPTVIDFCNYSFREKNPEMAQRFIRDVVTGDGVSSPSAAYALREKLIVNSKPGMNLSRLELIFFFFKAWNHYVKNRPLKLLKWIEGEDFPEVLA